MAFRQSFFERHRFFLPKHSFQQFAGCTSFNPFLGRAPKILLGFPLPLPASWLYGSGQKPVKKKNPAIAQWIRLWLGLLEV
jgi:hypothetical protein